MNKFNYELNKDDYKFLSTVKLSINRAVLGEIIPSLREIKVVWQPGDEVVKIIFYHSGNINDAVQSHYSSIMAEVCGDCWEYQGKLMDCDYDVVRLDYPQPLPKGGGFAVYSRKEPFEDPI
jgi:hypothetical protein